MKLSKKSTISIIAGTCFLLGGIYWISHFGSQTPAPIQNGRTETHQTGQQPSPLEAAPGTQVASAPVVETAGVMATEVMATRRMYAEHAPLRALDVADPDSEANREILQTMVLKALQRKAADAPAGNPASSQ
jgi:hypothetical protein